MRSQTKHIDIQYHYIRDEVSTGRVFLSYTPIEEMVGGLTKPLSAVKFHRFIK